MTAIQLKSHSLKTVLFAMGFVFVSNVGAEPLLKRHSTIEREKQAAQLKEQMEAQKAMQAQLNKLNYDLYQQVEAMQLEIQGLRGTIEEQSYVIERFKKAERERYADLDRRVNELSQRGVAAASPSTSAINADDEDEKTYLSAKQKVDSKEYSAAIAEFTLYQEFFPEGKYLAQSNYWLGELYLALEVPEYENAKKHFDKVVKDFPESSKVPDSLYKIGTIELVQKKAPAARDTFQKLVKRFPKSASAKLAKRELEKL